MRILTYNVHGWRTAEGEPNLQAVTHVLAAAQADIIGLNEVFYPRELEPGAGPALEAVASALQMHFVFGPCLRWPAQETMPPTAYGNALLSRWPILANAAHQLTAVPDKEQRGLLEARVALPSGRAFTAYVTHLDHTSENARLTQVRALRTWTVRDRSRPHVIMGDFNSIAPWDFAERPDALAKLAQHPKGANLANEAGGGPKVVAQMEKAGYTDVYAQRGRPGAQTYIPATDPPVRIDYIFASQPLAPALQDCGIHDEEPGTEASDHRPVYADFDLSALPE